MRVSFARETIVRLRYPLIDDQGTQVADYSAEPEELPIKRCWLEPLEATAVVEDRLAVSTGFKGTAPKGTELDALIDLVRYRGLVYELAGDAVPVTSPTGALDEVTYTLRRWRHAR